jgi:AraC family transcriptional regulator, transcriptional activator of pobA
VIGLIIVITTSVGWNTFALPRRWRIPTPMDSKKILPLSSSHKRNLSSTGIAVYEISNNLNAVPFTSEKGLYKICLFTNNSTHLQGDEEKVDSGAALLFVTPRFSLSLTFTSVAPHGYVCFFTDQCFKNWLTSSCNQKSSMHAAETASSIVFCLRPKQKDFIRFLLERMMLEQHTAYVFKSELLSNYLFLLLSEIAKMKGSVSLN